MKQKHLSISVVISFCLALTYVGLALAQGAVGSVFTYQGRLQRAGEYLDGATCNFRFSLFDSPAGGSQVGNTQTVANVSLVDGYFMVDLNNSNEFGATAFSGNKRYLAIEVQCPGDSGYIALNSQRVAINAVPYAIYGLNTTDPLVPWSQIFTKPAGFADDIDNYYSYTNGFGLNQTGTQFSVNPPAIIGAIPPNTYQNPVTGACSGMQAIRVINVDGSVVCAPTTNVTYVAGQGLTLTGNVFSIDEVYVQQRVTTDCGPNKVMRFINQDGTAVCEDIPQGDITSLGVGSGLTGGGSSGDVTISIPDDGITTDLLTDGAVTSGKVQAGAISTAKLAAGAVVSTTIVDYSIGFVDFAGPCANGQTVKWQALNNSWGCANDTVATYTGGAGLAIADDTLSANTTNGVKIDADQITLDFANQTGSSSTQAAHSDHDHGSAYVGFWSWGSGDLTGYFNTGFNVVKIQNQNVTTDLPGYGYILRYDNGQWSPAPYNFPLNFDIVSVDVIRSDPQCKVQAHCPSGYQVMGGGCQCPGDEQLQINKYWADGPHQDWECECTCTNNTVHAYALCIKTQYE